MGTFVEEAKLDTLKTSLKAFEFSPAQTPLRRSARKHSQVKQDPDTSPSLTSVLDSNRWLKWKLSFPSLSDGLVTMTPRKRSRIKEEGSLSSKKMKRGFAPPELYAHLNFLQDHLRDSLDVMFCGINPGCMSAEVGHHFANPTNHFWKCLHQSQLTERLLLPSEDFTLPVSYNLGLTNLVDRPSAEQAELSKTDMVNGVPGLLRKILKFRPRVVCFVGKGIWEIFVKEATKEVSLMSASSPSTPSSYFFLSLDTPSAPVENEVLKESEADVLPTLVMDPKPAKKPRRTTKKKLLFSWGIQSVKVVHPEAVHGVKESLFFVMPSTSGRVVSHQLPDKVKLFSALRERVADSKGRKIDTKDMVVVPHPKVAAPSDA